MSGIRGEHTATLLPSGKLLVAGGANILGDGIPGTEIFDPTTGTWASAGAMALARKNHTATLLPDGKVLIAGGASTYFGSGLASTEVYDPATGAWTYASPMVSARREHTATLLPTGKVLVVGGRSGSNYLTLAEVYDPATGTWTATGSLPAPRASHTATLLPDGKVLVAGGWNGDASLNSVSVYDPATGAWTSTGALVSARNGHTAMLLPNGKVLVAGGNGLSAETYDPGTGTWTTTGSLATAHDGATATLLPSGRVLIAGGNGPSSAGTEEYDAATGTWTTTGALSIGRYHATATLLPSGKVLVAGGSNSGQSQRSVDLYDPGAGAWASTAAPASAHNGHTATVLPDGTVLVAGGSNAAGPLTGAEVYAPTTGAWASTGSMGTARSRHTASLLLTGKVLVTGGFSASGTLASAEVYDPATGTWTPTGTMDSPREGHTATVLPDGKVLVAGGINGSALTSAEVYDPATGTWATTGAMGDRRDRHTATRLPNGKVLVAGGSDPGARFTAELYDAATGTWSETGRLNIQRYDHAATMLPNGRVLIAGGDSGSGYVQRTEEYDPARGIWLLMGSMATGRVSATATTLTSGKAFIIGGSSTTSSLASMEVYDPGTGEWASADTSLNTPRTGHAVTLLPDGKVLVTGGSSNGSPLVSAEVYEDTGALAAWRPGFQAPSAALRPQTAIQLTGNHFRGVSEASSGNSQSSATNFPMLGLMAVEGGAQTRMPRGNYSDTSVTGTVPSVQAGYYFLTVITNGIPGGRMVLVQGTPMVPPVVLTPANGAVLTTTTPVISGTAEADNTVTVLVDGQAAGTAQADAGGNWSFTPSTALSQGTHSVTARATDAAGNTSPDAPSRSFTVDSVAPDAPVVATPANGAVVKTVNPVISGTAEAASTVTVLLDGVSAGTAKANAGGNWTFTPSTALSQGTHSVTARATDAVGNTSPDAPTRSFSVDSVAPDAPVLLTPANGAVVKTVNPVISGTAEAASTVTVLLDGQAAGTAKADAGGSWSFTPSTALAQGTHSVTARATDAAGNTSTNAPSRSFSVDSVAPGAPVVATPANGAVVTTVNPVISGTAEAGSTVTVLVDGQAVGTPQANAGGNWSFTPSTALSQGTHSVTARATDAAGNTSPDAPSRSFSVDSVAPDAPVVATPANGAVVTTVNPVISGTAEAGSTVTVLVDGQAVGTPQANAGGNWSFTPATALSQGSHTVTARATDAVGTTSPDAPTRSFSVDSVAPAVPVVATPANSAVVKTATPAISGTAEAASTVTVLLDGQAAGTTQADAGGNWSFTPSTALAQGTHSVTARATDAAGNTSPDAPSSSFSVDSVAPEAPVVTTPANGAVVKTATPVISGTAEAGSTVVLSVDGNVIGSTRANSDGTWRFELAEGLSSGSHTLVASAVDTEGNQGPASAPTAFTITLPSTQPQPEEGGGCTAAPASAVSWMAVAVGLSALRRRKRQGAVK
ncbi:Ig-like domain-containing protein [Corallococcus carmarthensis]|nr:Ig-like domain-containing protein [Corallococcus carmarthensis]